ncbi:hypothetical protein HDU85_000463 [Gaertneriomyces sp. JEL0708]|nr:hypothetical protein HDU85_000463 [Gaertneriomyces sp. JEL0708]
MASASISPRSVLVFSGGSAMNSFVTLLQNVTDDTAYVMPVSDDGGSTSEIIKALGGPGIGDLRSRIVRLAETGNTEARAVHDLLSYRLPFDAQDTMSPASPVPLEREGGGSAKSEWLDILEGRHRLWRGISEPYRETIRAFLVGFQNELYKTAVRGPQFDFQGGSIGNFFLTGSRLFFNNLDAAVFQFMRILRVPPRTEVIPVVATARGSVTIAAELQDQSVIVGQCDISHPGLVLPVGTRTRTGSLGPGDASSPVADIPHHAPTPMSPERYVPFNSLRRNISANLVFSKSTCPPLPSAIRRIYYVNQEHQEIHPEVNPLVVAQIKRKRTILYGCGSLYTSILPCLIVPGVGRLLADSKLPIQQVTSPIDANIPPVNALRRPKIVMLNGTHDRETHSYTALDFILAITDALNYSVVSETEQRSRTRRRYPSQGAVQALACLETRSNGTPHHCLSMWCKSHGRSACTVASHDESHLASESGRRYCVVPHAPSKYITHLVYPEDGEVTVDIEKIEGLGIKCIRVATTGGQSSGFYSVDELAKIIDALLV